MICELECAECKRVGVCLFVCALECLCVGMCSVRVGRNVCVSVRWYVLSAGGCVFVCLCVCSAKQVTARMIGV